MENLVLNERKIIEKAVENSEVFVASSKSGNYADLVSKIISRI